MPRNRGLCWVKDRIAATNMVKNIIRAVRSGNCKRAEHIFDHREYHWVTQCTSYATQARVHRLVRECGEKRRGR